jgi:predicted deacylase
MRVVSCKFLSWVWCRKSVRCIMNRMIYGLAIWHIMYTDKFQYSGSESWPSLLVLGAIHGNEICGPIAIQRIMQHIDNGLLSIKGWSVTFVPISNPEAYKQWVRYVDTNLNRLFGHKEMQGNSGYEEWIVGQLEKLVETHDYLVDIHSLSGGNDVFLFQSKYDQQTTQLALSTWVSQCITWRDQVYHNQWWTTDDYAWTLWIPALCVECGRHTDPHAPQIAYDAIIGIMKHLWLLPWKPTYIHNRVCYAMKKLYRKNNQWNLITWVQHGDTFSQGEIVAGYDDGSTICAPYDWVVLLPKHWAAIGDEWFYYGVIEKE